MAVTDPIADMLTKIRNASSARKETVEVKNSKFNEAVAKIFKDEKYIANYKILEDKRQGILKIYLRYFEDHSPAITGLRRISTPGLKCYVGKDKIPHVQGGLGTAILSTPKGLMTDKKARDENIGGEVICHVW